MFTANYTLALDTINQRPTLGIPTRALHIMEHAHLERLAGVEPGAYRQRPEEVYLAAQLAIGACLADQYIPTNPLQMGSHGYEGASRSATTGVTHIICDDITIDSPEAVVRHMEEVLFPQFRQQIASFNESDRTNQILQCETAVQQQLGASILKTGHGFITFPRLEYGRYGYEGYLMAYVLYPEVIAQQFALQAELSLLNNRAVARAYREGGLPPMFRLDHDMADSRGTLVSIKSLDDIWFPQFTRCLQPVLDAGVKLLWHCDGNLMAMVPRLIDAGVKGFQGFQYEDGMDYEAICRMKARDGDDLLIMAGVSVTTTLPMGTPADVKRELDWLVEYGPRTGLFLGASSSVTPGVPWENLQTCIEGLTYYRTHGRN